MEDNRYYEEVEVEEFANEFAPRGNEEEGEPW